MLFAVLVPEGEKCTEYDNLQLSIFLSCSNHVFLLLQMPRSGIPEYGWYSDFFYPVSHSSLAKTLRDDDSHSLLVMLNNCVQNGKAMFPVTCFVCCSAKQENNYVLRHTNFCHSGKEKNSTGLLYVHFARAIGPLLICLQIIITYWRNNKINDTKQTLWVSWHLEKVLKHCILLFYTCICDFWVPFLETNFESWVGNCSHL